MSFILYFINFCDCYVVKVQHTTEYASFASELAAFNDQEFATTASVWQAEQFHNSLKVENELFPLETIKISFSFPCIMLSLFSPPNRLN